MERHALHCQSSLGKRLLGRGSWWPEKSGCPRIPGTKTWGGCTCLHMTDIVTKTNLQDYGPRCLCLLKSWTCGCFLQRWYVFIHIYSISLLWRKLVKVSPQNSRDIFVGKNLATELPIADHIRCSHFYQRSAEAWQLGQQELLAKSLVLSSYGSAQLVTIPSWTSFAFSSHGVIQEPADSNWDCNIVPLCSTFPTDGRFSLWHGKLSLVSSTKKMTCAVCLVEFRLFHYFTLPCQPATRFGILLAGGQPDFGVCILVFIENCGKAWTKRHQCFLCTCRTPDVFFCQQFWESSERLRDGQKACIEVRTLGGRRSKGRDSRGLLRGHFGNSSTGQFLPKSGTEDCS